MKSQSPLPFLLPLLLVAFLGAGCAEDPVATDGGNDAGLSLESMDLNLAYGGLAYSDESAAFGDAALLDEAMAEEDAALRDAENDADAVADVPLLRDAPDADLVRTYVRIVWGNLEGARASLSDQTPETGDFLTWDGGLAVSEGNALVLRKTILFERLYDHLLPRDNRQTLAWHSTTLPHVDGVLVCIVSRPADDGSLAGDLTFRTPLLTKSFALADLANLDETVAVDDLGNGVSFHGFTPPPAGACPQGFLGGRWHHASEEDGGGFAGRLVTADGRLLGYMMGRYGTNDADERVFAGKIIGPAGRIRGLMQGTWEPSADHEGAGSFVGRWVGAAHEHKGILKGRYQTRPDRPGGVFEGMWEENCGEGDA